MASLMFFRRLNELFSYVYTVQDAPRTDGNAGQKYVIQSKLYECRKQFLPFLIIAFLSYDSTEHRCIHLT